jgi:hypothetical protein
LVLLLMFVLEKEMAAIKARIDALEEQKNA